jgi:Rieske Fe-S protein
MELCGVELGLLCHAGRYQPIGEVFSAPPTQRMRAEEVCQHKEKIP